MHLYLVSNIKTTCLTNHILSDIIKYYVNSKYCNGSHCVVFYGPLLNRLLAVQIIFKLRQT